MSTTTSNTSTISIVPTADNTITVGICGQDVPMRHRFAKTGNHQWAVMNVRKDGTRYYTTGGVKIPALDTGLPAFVELDGNSVALNKPGVINGEPVALTVKRTGTASVEINGDRYTVKVVLRDMQDGTWNLVAQTNRASSGGFTNTARSIAAL